jgi:hypothetical protein
MRSALACAAAVLLVGCAPPAIDQGAVDASASRIEARLESDCQVLVIAGAIGAVVSIAVPGAGLVEVAVDRACTDPAGTAHAIAVGEELAKRIHEQR